MALFSSPENPINLRPVAYSATAMSAEAGSLAQLVPPGNTPDVSAAGRDMTISWAESVLTGGTPASGYVVRRFDTNNVEQTVLAGCDTIITGLTCTENLVPAGTWKYTVTPLFNSWMGTASLESAPRGQ